MFANKCYIFRPFNQYFVEAALAAITAWSLLGYDATSLSHLYLECFSHFLCRSSQALSGWIGSNAVQLFSGLSRDVRSGSQLDSGWATRTFRDLSRSHSCVVFAVCLGSLSCWKVNISPSLRSLSRFSSRSYLYFAPFIVPSILTGLPVAEKHPHSMMLPPLCFTVGMVTGFLQT